MGLLPEIEDVQGQEHLLFMTEEDRIDGKRFEDGIHFELVQLEAACWMEDDDDESGKKGKKESNRQRRLKAKKDSDTIPDGALVGLRATYLDFLSQNYYRGKWQGLHKEKNIVQETPCMKI